MVINLNIIKMKKYLLLFLFIGIISNVIGQNIVTENKLWSNTMVGTENLTHYESYYIKFHDDTTINFIAYKKIWRCDDSLQSNWYIDGYIREDTSQKVFLYPINNNYRVDSDKETLIYDFNINIGDSLQLPYDNDGYIYLDSIGYEKLDNGTDSVKTYIFYSSSDNNAGYLIAKWYENIGGSGGVLAGLNITTLVGAEYHLVCYYNNDVLMFHNNDFSTCFPAPYPNNINSQNLNSKNFNVLYNNSQIIFNFPKFKNANSKLDIYNINGAHIKTIEINEGQEFILNKDELCPGMYLCRYRNKELLLSNKFVVN